MPKSPSTIEARLFDLTPVSGAKVNGPRLRAALARALGKPVSQASYDSATAALVKAGKLAVDDRTQAVRRLLTTSHRPVRVVSSRPVKIAAAREKRGKSGKSLAKATPVIGYRHEERRVNNPEVGMVTPDTDPVEPTSKWAYDPNLDPQLQWAGKSERTSFEVDTVSLHVHERIEPATLVSAMRTRQAKDGSGPATQTDMFAAWFEKTLPYREAIEFYKHDRGWANRLIAGDSLLVMNSLIQKESMAGKVQMIYLDPPYGIKYGSNFQPFVNKRDVKDRKDEDLTQEPEMIKAFRDTWELGIHSYLTYLRDRLLLGRQLLADTGSVFVQISDENLHHVREIMDEVFGPENVIAVIVIEKTSSSTEDFLAGTTDYLLWYSKDKTQTKYQPVFKEKKPGQTGATGYTSVRMPNGKRLPLDGEAPENGRIYALDNLASQSVGREKGEGASCWFPVPLKGWSHLPSMSTRWKTNEDGMRRLLRAGRVDGGASRAGYVRYLDDFPVYGITNLWDDVMSSWMTDKVYVVQTNLRIVERCMLMTTDPGDLVFDPTCGSGTTAYTAEKLGRRWITCDTSRVATTVAKQRLMTASFEYFALKYPHEGLKGGFVYKTVPHTTLKSIASNPEIDTIWERDQPAIQAALANLNAALRAGQASAFRVLEGAREGFLVDFNVSGKSQSSLPNGDRVAAGLLLEWEVPPEFPEEWPRSALSAFEQFHAARLAMQTAIDVSISTHADQEQLRDVPSVDKGKLRVTGPFTVEAVPFPSVLSLDETQPAREADVAIARSGESSRQHGWKDELLKTGIRGKGGQILKFAELDTLAGTLWLHCSGTLAETGERVVVSFGPPHALLEQRAVENAIREAGELFPRPKLIIFCAFAFDPEAAKDIDVTKGIVALKAQMNTDLLTEDLKKERASNQSFWLMGQPDVEVRKLKDGRFEVEVNGFDYFDTAKGELVSGGKKKIASWMLDTDYDDRSLFPRQVFFPMAGDKDGWSKLRKDIKAELSPNIMDRMRGTVSVPFEAGTNNKVAVKIVDDRGIESLKVIPLP